MAGMERSSGGPARRGATVEFRRVTKRFGRNAAADPGRPAAVNELSLTVLPGAICVLVGPSGCGKTTTLKMVNRLIEPTDGQVLIDGQDVARVEVTALRRGIGYVIQQIGLLPHQTIGENIATVPRLLGWPREKIWRRVDELLELVELDPAVYRDRYPAQLSGGERQRVGVARAIAAEPPVLLMDEPFGAVDPIVRERLQDEFLRLHRRLGMTVLLVTHDIDEALKLGDRVAVMRQGGRLAQYATPAELLARPADEFVARFIGADRGLKRLGLMRVGEALLTTELANAPAAGRVADPSAPRFTPVTTLREALSTLLAAGAQRGPVIDDAGRYLGDLTLEAIAAALRRANASREPGGPPGEARGETVPAAGAGE